MPNNDNANITFTENTEERIWFIHKGLNTIKLNTKGMEHLLKQLEIYKGLQWQPPF